MNHGDATRHALDSRLRTLRALYQEIDVLDELVALQKQAAKELGPEDEVTLEIAAATAWVGIGRIPLRKSQSQFEDLLERLGDRKATPVHYAPNTARSGYAKVLRLVGDPRALQEYRLNVSMREAEDPHARAASVARLNLATALRESFGPTHLAEALRLAVNEVGLRSATYGPEDRFTLVAREVCSQIRLALLRDKRPVMPIDELLVEQRAIVQARTNMLGAREDRTINSQITLAEILCEAGEVEEALWLLTIARAAAFDVPPDKPERLLLVLAECCLRSNDAQDLIGGRLYAQEALQEAERVYGTRSPQADRCRKATADVESALKAAGIG